MKEIIDIAKGSSALVITLVILAYFLKVYLEKTFEALAGRISEIGKTSLDVKKSLRNEERAELVDFRVALLKWEDSLLNMLVDFTNLSPSEAALNDFFKSDKKLFLNVKIAVVKAGVYLRNPELEVRLMAAVTKIRNAYYPLIFSAMPRLIDLQAQMIPFEQKMKDYKESGMKDMAFAPTADDRDFQLTIQTQMTAEIADFSERLLADYATVATLLVELKEEVNTYLYRPILTVDINRD